MKITVKCFATLADRQPSGAPGAPGATGATGATAYDFSGTTLAQLLDELSISRDEVALLFVNNLHSKPDRELKEGDRVGIFPPVGGG